MIFDRVFRQFQFLGNDPVGISRCGQDGNLLLPGSQLESFQFCPDGLSVLGGYELVWKN